MLEHIKISVRRASKRLLLVFLLFSVAALVVDEDRHFDEAAGNTAPKPKQTTITVKKSKKSTKEIKTLDEALKSGVPVIVKLGSDRCIPCRMMNPVIKELAEEQEGKMVFLSLDVYENRELARQAGVRVIPTILFYDKHGKPKAKSEGGMSKEDLLKAIKELELNK